MKFKLIKNFLKTLIPFLIVTPIFSAQLFWDPSPDANIVSKYNIYERTNGIINTNFTLIGSTSVTNNNYTTTLPDGISLSLYVTATDTNNLESDPSNILIYLNPIGVPPSNILTSTSISSYNPVTKIWNNVQLAWNPVDFTKYALTNYNVIVEGPTSTNSFSTVNNTYTIPTLSRASYKIYVLTTNSKGTSPISSVWNINGNGPGAPILKSVSP